MFKYIKNSINGEIYTNIILRTKDGANIPFHPANTDYQQYLKWLDEGNTPEPADE